MFGHGERLYYLPLSFLSFCNRDNRKRFPWKGEGGEAKMYPGGKVDVAVFAPPPPPSPVLPGMGDNRSSFLIHYYATIGSQHKSFHRGFENLVSPEMAVFGGRK